MEPTPPAFAGGGIALLLRLVLLVESACPSATNIFGCETEQPNPINCCRQMHRRSARLMFPTVESHDSRIYLARMLLLCALIRQ
jgi:hypothetical protein